MQNMEKACNDLLRCKYCLVLSAEQLHVIALVGSLEVSEKMDYYWIMPDIAELIQVQRHALLLCGS